MEGLASALNGGQALDGQKWAACGNLRHVKVRPSSGFV